MIEGTNMPVEDKDPADVEELLDEFKKFHLAKTQEGKLEVLGNFIFGPIAKCLRDLRARLPFKPWLVKVLSGVSVIAILTIVWGASNLAAQIKFTRDCANEAKRKAESAVIISEKTDKENYDKLDARLRPTEQGIVKLNADWDNYMKSRGVRPSTPEEWKVMRARLAMDTVKKDSTK